ncbi:MAG: hypothetical protein ACXW4M_06230 [Anaerolineales bacterium]
MPIFATYSKTIAIPKTTIDENGHVNNVAAYVQWMHAESTSPWSITSPLAGRIPCSL